MSNKPGLSKERIVHAAFEYADVWGLDSLSMRNLAKQLHVQAMSLYNHIKNKDELLDLLVERLVEEFELPNDNDTWQVAMQKRAISMFDVLLKHPWGTMPLVSRINIGPASLHFFDRSLSILKNAGFSNEEADHILVSMNGYIYGFTLAELNFPLKGTDYGEEARKHANLFPKDVYPALYSLSKDIQEEKYSGMSDFQLGIEFLIKGIEFKYSK